MLSEHFFYLQAIFSPPPACVILIVSKQVCLSVPALVHVTMFLCQMEHYGLQGTAVTTNAQVINIDRITDDLLPDSHETWGYEDISLQLPVLTDRRCEIDWAMCWCFVLFCFFTSAKKIKKQLIEKKMLHLVMLGVIAPYAPTSVSAWSYIMLYSLLIDSLLAWKWSCVPNGPFPCSELLQLLCKCLSVISRNSHIFQHTAFCILHHSCYARRWCNNTSDSFFFLTSAGCRGTLPRT